MGSKGQLNERQRAVLRWIGDGCPAGVMQGESHKATARALHHRKLVKVSRPAGRWQASLTADGEYFLEHGAVPARPSRQTPSRSTERAATPVAPAPPEPNGVTVDLLLAKLDEGGGSFTIADPDVRTRGAWRRAIDAARRGGRLPEGKHLAHRGRDRGDLHVHLRDGVYPVHERAGQAVPWLAVPDEVPQVHPLLGTLQDPAAMLGISPTASPRALRLLYVLLTAAEAEGCEVGWAADPARGLAFRADDQHVDLVVEEERERRDVLSLPDSDTGGTSYPWQRIRPQAVEIPSGRLVLTLENDWQFSGRRRSWADRQRWRLEDKLGDVLAEILWRLQALGERHRAKEQELAQRQMDWHAAVARATAAHAEAQRVAALDAQLAGWEKAKQIRTYCEAIETAHADTADDRELRGWIEWARAHADTMDPTGRKDLPPVVIEPRTYDLAPFLPKGTSPYGPPQS